MVSNECRQILDFINQWMNTVLQSCDEFDVARARNSFKLMSRAPHARGTKVALPHGVAGEWVCNADSAHDLRALYLHGGGYIFGDLDTTVPFAQLIAGATGCSVLALEYRLAPEHPFPCALYDAVHAFRWLLRNGPHGSTPAQRTFILGDSAGGGLTLSTLMILRDAGEPLPDSAVTFSALTDLSLRDDSPHTPARHDPVLKREFLRLCSKAYASGADTTHPYVSPVYGDPTGFPPLFMQVGGREILLEDTIRFAEKAQASGVEVTLDVWPEMFHAWQLFAQFIPEAQAAIARVGDHIKAFCADTHNVRRCGTSSDIR